MLRRMVLGGLMVVLLMGLVGSGEAAVRVNIGIDLPAPPPLVVVPGTPVSYAPGGPANYFAYGGRYYVFTNGGWYVGPGYNGPWAVLPPAYVPQPILRVPVRYYHVAPASWNHWRREAPPRWAPAWGQRWHGPEHRWHGPQHRDRRDGHRDGHDRGQHQRGGHHRDGHQRGEHQRDRH